MINIILCLHFVKIITQINNLFYNIEYITYICLGHGVSYLKDILYQDYYSNKIYNIYNCIKYYLKNILQL